MIFDRGLTPVQLTPSSGSRVIADARRFVLDEEANAPSSRCPTYGTYSPAELEALNSPKLYVSVLAFDVPFVGDGLYRATRRSEGEGFRGVGDISEKLALPVTLIIKTSFSSSISRAKTTRLWILQSSHRATRCVIHKVVTHERT